MTTLEEKAFLDALYADNSEDLKKFLLKLTLNPDITDDVLQETFCEACKKAEKLMVQSMSERMAVYYCAPET